MKHVLIVDTNKAFLSDIEARCFLDDIKTVDMASSLEEAYKKSDEVRYDEVIVAAGLLDDIGDYQDKPFTARCVTYASNAGDILEADKKGYRSYGIIKNSGDLLNAIDSGSMITVEGNSEDISDDKRRRKSEPELSDDEYYDDEEDVDDDYFASKSIADEKQKREGSARKTDSFANDKRDNDDIQSDPRRVNKGRRESKDAYREDYDARDDDYDYREDDAYDRQRNRRIPEEPRSANRQRRDDDYYQDEQVRGPEDDYHDGQRRRRTHDDYYDDEYYDDEHYEDRPRRRDNDKGKPRRERSGEGERRREPRRDSSPRSDIRSAVTAKRASSNDSYRENEFEVERDMGNIIEPARIVTVYSAKGGVGKTTLACELATFLALSAHGRDRLKVCLVDFNVDFGDVLNTLALNPKKRGMSNWSEQIKERLYEEYGEHEYTDDEIDSIEFTKAEIDDYLQAVPESDLQVLIAPISNEDSMELMLGGEDIRIMLRNLKENGELDFIICDTGNNTRNSAFIPLEMSDDILMIVTQSVNTANCNSSFLSTLDTIGFETRTIKVVVNRARSKKLTGISVDELLEVMCDPRTKRQLDCAGVIREEPEVEVAENRGIPLVYDPSSAFTKSIAQIAKVVNQESFALKKPEKKGFFSKLFSSNK